MNTASTNDEMSLKEIILKVQSYLHYLWIKKWWIGLGIILSAALFVYRVHGRPARYTGTLTLSPNTPDPGAALGGVGSILGQIGLGGSGENPLIKVRALGQTYEVITKSLLDTAIITGKPDLIANHLLELHNFDEEVFPSMGESFQGFRFSSSQRDSFSLQELKIMKLLYSYVTYSEDNFLEASQEEETGTITYELTTYSTELTIALLDRLYHNLRNTYIQQSIAPQQRTLNELEQRRDSIKARLETVEYQLAGMQDRTRGLTSSRQLVQQANLQREANLLNGTYLEVLRNKESADFLLKTAKPELQIVQAPVLPLDYQGTNYPFAAIFGGIFGGFLTTIWFLLRKIYQETMASDAE